MYCSSLKKSSRIIYFIFVFIINCKIECVRVRLKSVEPYVSWKQSPAVYKLLFITILPVENLI